MSMSPYWTRKRIIEAIRDWHDMHGQPPTYAEWEKASPLNPPAAVVGRRFVCWNHAIEAAGFKSRPQGRTTRYWTPERILDAIKQWAHRHGGKPPTQREWYYATADHPNHATVAKNYGSWNRAIWDAGYFTRGASGCIRYAEPPVPAHPAGVSAMNTYAPKEADL